MSNKCKKFNNDDVLVSPGHQPHPLGSDSAEGESRVRLCLLVRAGEGMKQQYRKGGKKSHQNLEATDHRCQVSLSLCRVDNMTICWGKKWESWDGKAAGEGKKQQFSPGMGERSVIRN